MKAETYCLKNSQNIFSPALVYYEDIIRDNTKKIIEIAGGPQRLWPHVKSHKMTKMIEMQMEMGITRFKCATLAEAEMAAGAGVKKLLMAYPLVGPNINAFIQLSLAYPGTEFFALGDDLESLKALDEQAAASNADIGFFIDVNMGMNRTGVETAGLYEFVKGCSAIKTMKPWGLHCYDGHVHTTDIQKRRDEVAAMMRDINGTAQRLREEGIELPVIIAGGSPSFPCHAENTQHFLSPGTVFLWDSGYLANYPDLNLKPAAAVMTRVISHPAKGLFTLDLGCKGIASDPQGIKGTVVGLTHAAPLFQSEEHWTYKMEEGFEEDRPKIGTVFYVIPTHICPTTALYSHALVAKEGELKDKWTVDARR